LSKQARELTRRETALQEGFSAGYAQGYQIGYLAGMTDILYKGFGELPLAFVYTNAQPGTKAICAKLQRLYNSRLALEIRKYNYARRSVG